MGARLLPGTGHCLHVHALGRGRGGQAALPLQTSVPRLAKALVVLSREPALPFPGLPLQLVVGLRQQRVPHVFRRHVRSSLDHMRKVYYTGGQEIIEWSHGDCGSWDGCEVACWPLCRAPWEGGGGAKAGSAQSRVCLGALWPAPALPPLRVGHEQRVGDAGLAEEIPTLWDGVFPKKSFQKTGRRKIFKKNY